MTNPETPMTFDSLFSLRRHLRIEEHSPGYLRLKIAMSLLKDPAASDLPRFDRTPPGVRSVKFSLFSRTVTMEYDTAMFPPALLEELVLTQDFDRGRAILADLEERMGERIL